MMNWDKDKLRNFVLTLLQPMKVGKSVSQLGVKASLDNLYPSGSSDKFTLTYPFGMVARLPGGVTAFYDSLFGNQHEQIITALLHSGRPDPISVGDVVFYSTDTDGVTIKSKITLKNDGTILLESPTDIYISTVNSLIISASTKTTVTSPKIDLGDSGLEKVVNGETFLEFYNNHVHYDSFGLPTSPPAQPMVAGTHLSSKVKAAK